jgi:predicted DNA-binding transcriptional regulator AlpA
MPPLTSIGQSDHDRMEAADLISVAACARMPGIDVHPDTLYRLCRAGQFPPAIKIGRQWRISVPRLQRFLHGEGS